MDFEGAGGTVCLVLFVVFSFGLFVFHLVCLFFIWFYDLGLQPIRAIGAQCSSPKSNPLQ